MEVAFRVMEHPEPAIKTTSFAVGNNRLTDALLLIHHFLPMLIGWSLALVMRRATGAVLSPSGLMLLLAGIGAAYSFDRIIDTTTAFEPPPLWLQRMLYRGFAACVCTMFILLVTRKIQTEVLLACIILSVISLLYSYLKRVPLAKTLGVAMAWTWASATLPFAGNEHARLAWAWLDTNVTLPLLLLLSSACILCDLKDAAKDRYDRIPSLPVLVGVRWTCLVATGLALAAAVTAALHYRGGVAIASLLLAIAAQLPRLLSLEIIGSIVIDSILVVPGVLIFSGIV